LNLRKIVFEKYLFLALSYAFLSRRGTFALESYNSEHLFVDYFPLNDAVSMLTKFDKPSLAIKDDEIWRISLANFLKNTSLRCGMSESEPLVKTALGHVSNLYQTAYDGELGERTVLNAPWSTTYPLFNTDSSTSLLKILQNIGVKLKIRFASCTSR
jgi:hypothetical protein